MPKKVDRTRLRILLGLFITPLWIWGCGKNGGKNITGPEAEGLQSSELDEFTNDPRVPIRLRYSVRQILDEQFPGWQPWEEFPNRGDGIGTIPNILAEQGMCWIKINGQLVSGASDNIDNIIVVSGDLLQITEPDDDGNLLWSFRAPSPHTHQAMS